MANGHICGARFPTSSCDNSSHCIVGWSSQTSKDHDYHLFNGEHFQYLKQKTRYISDFPQTDRDFIIVLYLCSVTQPWHTVMPESHIPDENSTTRQKPQPRPFSMKLLEFTARQFTDATHRCRVVLAVSCWSWLCDSGIKRSRRFTYELGRITRLEVTAGRQAGRHTGAQLSVSNHSNPRPALDSTVMCILEPQAFVHWLLPHRVPSVTSHVAVWHSLLVSLQVCYWIRVVQGVSNKLRYNYKVTFSVHRQRDCRLALNWKATGYNTQLTPAYLATVHHTPLDTSVLRISDPRLSVHWLLPQHVLKSQLVHSVFDTSWRTAAQSSPSTVTADNQCTVDISTCRYADVNCALVVCCHSWRQRLGQPYPGGVKHRSGMELRVKGQEAIRATLTRTPSASSLLRARRAVFPSGVWLVGNPPQYGLPASRSLLDDVNIERYGSVRPLSADLRNPHTYLLSYQGHSAVTSSSPSSSPSLLQFPRDQLETPVHRSTQILTLALRSAARESVRDMFRSSTAGVAVVLWLACSPPTEANRVRFPARSLPDFSHPKRCRWSVGFSRGSPIAFRRCFILTSLHPRVKSRPNLSTPINYYLRPLVLNPMKSYVTSPRGIDRDCSHTSCVAPAFTLEQFTVTNTVSYASPPFSLVCPSCLWSSVRTHGGKIPGQDSHVAGVISADECKRKWGLSSDGIQWREKLEHPEKAHPHKATPAILTNCKIFQDDSAGSQTRSTV
ncbi:hypothetical protein PR048_029465 [Dryococelus australis]|uniref:Uncharacterized protein n=1 Tax=Dryococelus australis TaxID=614101 RepID=A0ABQ9GDG5_9NEOP|nr:hypothetical protein PR048_029465 [Dryococelus australis]